jgi:hypothetical protein
MNLPANFHDIARIYDPAHVGVVVIPDVLSPHECRTLLDDILRFDDQFEVRNNDYGKVAQEADLLYLGPVDPHRKDLDIPSLASFVSCYNSWFDGLGAVAGFRGEANSIRIHRFHAGSLGLTAHQDYTYNTCAISATVLEGDSDFLGGRSREGPFENFSAPPGSMILMRGPRNPEELNLRPFHAVTNITKTRYSVCLRYNSKELVRRYDGLGTS